MEHDFVPVEYSANQLFHLVFVIVDERGHCEVEKYMIFASLFFVRNSLTHKELSSFGYCNFHTYTVENSLNFICS